MGIILDLEEVYPIYGSGIGQLEWCLILNSADGERGQGHVAKSAPEIGQAVSQRVCCWEVDSLIDVGRKILGWERDHKCNVTTTGEA